MEKERECQKHLHGEEYVDDQGRVHAAINSNDGRLELSNHITYINTKIAKGVGIICRAKKILQYFSFN